MLLYRPVKLQLTKTKTIEIDFGSLGGKKTKGSRTDVSGIEMFSGSTPGCPAVRIYKKKGSWHLGAADYIPPPDGELPLQWEDVSKQPSWTMPRNFQSPDAALAVNSTMGVFGQSSPEAILQEMMHGVGQALPAPTASTSEKKKFGIKKAASTPAAPAPSAAPTASSRKPVFPDEGVPVSENGRRFVVKPFAEEGFYLSSSIPEFQSLWLSRLLPEGRRPTAVSLQLAESALFASILAQPEYLASKGTMLAVFVRENSVFFGGYKNGMPVLWRRCPGARGYLAMKESVKKHLGVEDDLVLSVLEDSLIDPRPALEPILHPIFDQLELARAYLSSKHDIVSDKILLVGLPFGAEHWARYAEESIHAQLIPVLPFDGLVVDKGIETKAPHEFLVALGAALAAAEAET